MKTMTSLFGAAALGALCFTLPAAQAAPTIYGGGASATDPTAGPGVAHPNTDAARAQFDAAASGFGTLTQLTFESSTLGDTTFDTNGIHVAGDNNYKFAGVSDSSSTITGFNTTSGGSKFLRLNSDNSNNAVTETFTFANNNPITAFGATFTGVGTANGSTLITFDDGTTQSVNLPGSSQGGTLFFGFTDANAATSIKSVTLGVYPVNGGDTGDVIGIDDVLLYNGVPSKPTLGTVPEPSEMAAMSIGIAFLGGLVLLARKRRATLQA
jgi:hypothetical protein